MWMREKLLCRRACLLVTVLSLSSLTLLLAPITKAKEIEPFGAIVKLVGSYYRVKQKRIPLMGLAKLGARVAGVKTAKNFKLAIFENQDFAAHNDSAEFAGLVGKAFTFDQEWQPLVLLQSTRDGEQVYTYTRSTKGDDIRLLLVNVGQRNATVLQVDIAPQALLKLLEQPDTLSNALTNEAADESPQ
jgi:hypothetical protein